MNAKAARYSEGLARKHPAGAATTPTQPALMSTFVTVKAPSETFAPALR